MPFSCSIKPCFISQFLSSSFAISGLLFEAASHILSETVKNLSFSSLEYPLFSSAFHSSSIAFQAAKDSALVASKLRFSILMHISYLVFLVLSKNEFLFSKKESLAVLNLCNNFSYCSVGMEPAFFQSMLNFVNAFGVFLQSVEFASASASSQSFSLAAIRSLICSSMRFLYASCFLKKEFIAAW
jgi:hypothetical protein